MCIFVGSVLLYDYVCVRYMCVRYCYIIMCVHICVFAIVVSLCVWIYLRSLLLYNYVFTYMWVRFCYMIICVHICACCFIIVCVHIYICVLYWGLHPFSVEDVACCIQNPKSILEVYSSNSMSRKYIISKACRDERRSCL